MLQSRCISRHREVWALIDIRHFKEVLDTINAILRDGDIAEVKRERIGIAVVRIKRKLEHPPKNG